MNPQTRACVRAFQRSEGLDETGEPAIDFGIGSSMGGIVTAACESLNPGLFRHIAMLDPPLHPGPGLRERLGLGLTAPNVDLIAMTKKRKVDWPTRKHSWRRLSPSCPPTLRSSERASCDGSERWHW